MNKKIEIIDNSNKIKCHKCEGNGNIRNVACDVCNGTGLWTEDSFYLIATQPDGTRIGFQVDSLGK